MQFLRTYLDNVPSSDNNQVAEWSSEETGELIINIIITNPYNRACMGAVLHFLKLWYSCFMYKLIVHQYSSDASLHMDYLSHRQLQILTYRLISYYR